MRRLLSTTLLSALAIFCAKAQTAEEAISYYLPKTAIHINLLIEKTTYEPEKKKKNQVFPSYAR